MMATTVRISANPRQHVMVSFDALVIVTGAPAGAKVRATLLEKSGKPPLWGPEDQTKSAPDVPDDGNRVFTFEVTLQGPTEAVLEATVTDDKGTYYPIAYEDIEVVEYT